MTGQSKLLAKSHYLFQSHECSGGLENSQRYVGSYNFPHSLHYGMVLLERSEKKTGLRMILATWESDHRAQGQADHTCVFWVFQILPPGWKFVGQVEVCKYSQPSRSDTGFLNDRRYCSHIPKWSSVQFHIWTLILLLIILLLCNRHVSYRIWFVLQIFFRNCKRDTDDSESIWNL